MPVLPPEARRASLVPFGNNYAKESTPCANQMQVSSKLTECANARGKSVAQERSNPSRNIQQIEIAMDSVSTARRTALYTMARALLEYLA
jgi:hypothetical protein